MTGEGDRDALLVVVRSEDQATAIETALSVRRIAAKICENMARIVEFGSSLGVHPYEVYVHRDDLARAQEVLKAEGLPRDERIPGLRL